MKEITLIDPVGTGRPFRTAAKAMGFRVTALYTPAVARPQEPSAQSALYEDVDEARLVASLDEALAAVGRGRYAAIIPASQLSVGWATRLAKHLGLEHNPELPDITAPQHASNLSAQGLALPAQRRCKTAADCVEAAQDIGFPVKISPRVDVQARLCRNPSEVRSAFYACASDSRLPRDVHVVEMHQHALDLTINLFGTPGGLKVIDAWSHRQAVNAQGVLADISVVQTPCIGPHLARYAANYAPRACKALDLFVGPIKVRLRLGEDVPKVVAVRTALPEPRIPELWQRHSTMEPYAATIQAFLGSEVDDNYLLPTFQRRLAVAFTPRPQAGRVRRVLGLEMVRELPSHEFSEVNLLAGEEVREGCTGTTAATFWLAATCEQDLLRDLERIESGVKFDTGPSPSTWFPFAGQSR